MGVGGVGGVVATIGAAQGTEGFLLQILPRSTGVPAGVPGREPCEKPKFCGFTAGLSVIA